MMHMDKELSPILKFNDKVIRLIKEHSSIVWIKTYDFESIDDFFRLLSSEDGFVMSSGESFSVKREKILTWSVATGAQLFYFLIAIILLVFVTVTDFEQYVIFDSMLLPLAVAGVCYTLHLQRPLTEHLSAALGGGLLFFVLTLLTKGAIGGGDIKLIAAMGLWLEIRPLINVIAFGFIAGGIAALFLLLTKQKTRHDYFAYGPYFALSGIGVLLEWFWFL